MQFVDVYRGFQESYSILVVFQVSKVLDSVLSLF